MVSNLDIYRSANLLIQQHGDGAAIRAAMMADKMLERGDLDGKATWLRIMTAIKDLQCEERTTDATLQ